MLSVIFRDSGDMVMSLSGFHFLAVGGVDFFAHLKSISKVCPVVATVSTRDSLSTLPCCYFSKRVGG